MVVKVTISYHNSALAGIPSINLPAVSTCRPDAPCYKLCYARRGNFKFSNVTTALENNLIMYLNHPEVYEQAVLVAARK